MSEPATSKPAPPEPRDISNRPRSIVAYAIAWATFWLLQTTLAVQEFWRQGGQENWKPLFWEGSSFVVATLVVVMQWRRIHRLDTLLSRPWSWFAANLRILPLVAPLFVAAVYALRHGVYGLIGQSYTHPSWGQVFGYEIIKFSAFYLMFVAIVFGIRTHAALSEAQIGIERQRRLAQQAQLLQLTQQIEPHFLFNALNTIAATIPDDPGLADKLLSRLAILLRAATEMTRKPESTIQAEVDLLQGYSAIMCQRFAGRVNIEFDIESETRPCRIPTLLLQPLLENAFHHGVEQHASRTDIRVGIRRNGDRLLIEVQDSTGEVPAAPVDRVGLSNLRERLQTRYGRAARFSLTPLQGGGAVAQIEMPCEY